MKIHVKAFCLTCGIIWGAAVFLLAWWLIILEGATGEPTFIGRIYPGFSISAAGSFIGFFWGFIDGLACGAVFAWLYNLLVIRFSGQKA